MLLGPQTEVTRNAFNDEPVRGRMAKPIYNDRAPSGSVSPPSMYPMKPFLVMDRRCQQCRRMCTSIKGGPYECDSGLPLACGSLYEAQANAAESNCLEANSARAESSRHFDISWQRCCSGSSFFAF